MAFLAIGSLEVYVQEVWPSSCCIDPLETWMACRHSEIRKLDRLLVGPGRIDVAVARPISSHSIQNPEWIGWLFA